MNKIFKVADIRKLEQQVSKGEISYSRMVEIMNEMSNIAECKVEKLPITVVMPRLLMKEQLHLKNGARILNVRGGKHLEKPYVIINVIEHWEPDDEFSSPEHDDAAYYLEANEIDMLIEKLREGKQFLNGV